MLKTICVGRRPDTPEKAVASAFTAHGVRPEHVEAERIGGEDDAWRWRLTPDAPVILDDEITTFDVQRMRGLLVPSRARHPSIERGVAADLDPVGWVIVVAYADGAVDEADLIDEARLFAADIQRMGEDNR